MTSYKAGPASIFSTHARRADLAPVQTCPKCQRQFTLGVNGTVDGCDECTKTERFPNGYAYQDKGCTCYEFICDNDDCPIHEKGGA